MKRRVLFYVQHLLGVGHVKRAAAITRAASKHPDLDVHVALGGQPVPLADFGEASVHQLPWARAEDITFQQLLDAEGRPVDAAWQTARRSALLDLATRIDPHVLLVEHFPFGRGKFAFELLPLFEMLRSRSDRQILCSVRDVLVEQNGSRRTDRAVSILREWFDRVLVHGDERVIPFETTFPAAAAIADMLHYTGYVVETDNAPQVRAPSRTDSAIVISVGGGAVGANLLRRAIDAAMIDDLGRPWHFLIGSNLPELEFQGLRSRSLRCSMITIERARPDFQSLLSRSALSISQAGYNTLMDVLVTRCQSIMVPFAAGSESEQSFRAREFERRGLVTVLDETALTSPMLLSAVRQALNAPRRIMADDINLDGARQTADFLARGAGG